MPALSLEQKRRLFHDGFLRLEKAVPQHLVREARRQINIGRAGAASDEQQAAQSAAVAAMFNESAVKPLLESGLGVELERQKGGQVALLSPSHLEHKISESGYHLDQIPSHSWQGHLDGLWNGSSAPLQGPDEDDSEWFGANQEGTPKGTNGVPFWLDDDQTLSISGFSCLVGIAVSEQLNDGDGQVGLLRGAHHHIERHFQTQRDQGGPIGPDGPGWPRVDTDAPNAHGLRHYPESVREQFREGAPTTPNGRYWPQPTMVKMAAGDAVLVLHAVPHGGSHVAGPDPRIQCYFRITTPERASHVKEALCDSWLDWKGMTDVIREERAKLAVAGGQQQQQQQARL